MSTDEKIAKLRGALQVPRLREALEIIDHLRQQLSIAGRQLEIVTDAHGAIARENEKLRAALKAALKLPRPWLAASGTQISWDEWDAVFQQIDEALSGRPKRATNPK